MPSYSSINIYKKMNQHSVIVALPLVVVTAFCFSYVLMQTPQRLKNNEASATSSKPSILTGTPLPEIKSGSIESTSISPLEPSPTSQATSSTVNTGGSSVSQNGQTSPQTPVTTNPQQAAPSAVDTRSYSSSNRASDLPTIKVNLSQTVTRLLNNL